MSKYMKERGLGRRVRLATAAVYIWMACLLLTACAAAPIVARSQLVWVSGSRAYVALRDSVSVEPGDRVTFRRDGATVAAGRVTRVDPAEMVQVTLDSGVLAAEKLEDLAVEWEQQDVVAPTSLRIGLPSKLRKTLLIECGWVAVNPQWPDSAYRTVHSGPKAVHLVRDATVAAELPWPDTLRVRFYDESADQEIALERGDIDVGVFWPGELSKHMRSPSRWGDPLRGARREWGVFLLHPDTSGVDPATISRLARDVNRDLFQNDLLELYRPDSSRTPSGSANPRFAVNEHVPGAKELQRYLDRWVARAGGPRRGDPITLGFSRILHPEKGRFSVDAYQGVPLLGIRATIVCSPSLRDYLSALGPDRLANLIECGGR